MVDRFVIFLNMTASFLAVMVLLTVLSIFAVKYYLAARQMDLQLNAEERYRALAERAVNAHEETTGALASLTQGISDIGAKLASTEKVLKDLE